MKKSTMWGLGLGAVALVVVVAVASTATAASPNAGKGLTESGVRHGIRYEGCSHFEAADTEAIKAWAMDNKWSFAKYALRLDELRANPEPAIVEVMTMLFPECPWPPSPETTFGPQKLHWAEALVVARDAVANASPSMLGRSRSSTTASTVASGQMFGDVLAQTFGVGQRAGRR